LVAELAAGVTALRRGDLAVRAGEVHVLLGENGRQIDLDADYRRPAESGWRRVFVARAGGALLSPADAAESGVMARR